MYLTSCQPLQYPAGKALRWANALFPDGLIFLEPLSRGVLCIHNEGIVLKFEGISGEECTPGCLSGPQFMATQVWKMLTESVRSVEVFMLSDFQRRK